MHKLFIINDWKTHYIYEYNTITRTVKQDTFQCKAGTQPDYSELEVYYSNRSASVDYTFVTSMSPFIFNIMKTVNTNNSHYDMEMFLNAVFTIAGAQSDNILIADYPDKLVFKLPLIKEFNEYIDGFSSADDLEFNEKVQLFSDRVEITLDRAISTEKLFYSNKSPLLCDIIIEYARILTKPFCKKTAIVNTDDFEVISLNHMDMDLCSAGINCRRADEDLAENTAEIDSELIIALCVANGVASHFGGKTKYSCSGHSFDLYSGYVMFGFKKINGADRRMNYFMDLLDKSSEEDPEFDDYFYVEHYNDLKLIIRFNKNKALELASILEPEEVVKNMVNKFAKLMDFVYKHRNDDPDKLVVPM